MGEICWIYYPHNENSKPINILKFLGKKLFIREVIKIGLEEISCEGMDWVHFIFITSTNHKM